MNKTLLLLAYMTLLMACNNSSERDSVKPEPGDRIKSMKGFDLFVWNSDGKIVYTLLPGTNRHKDSSEIYDRENAVELSGLKKKINNIADGEYIFIRHLNVDTSDMKELRLYLRTKELIVSE